MTPTPLDKIGLRWRDHKSALWWLGLLYRRPTQFQESGKNLPRLKSLKVAFELYLHALIYIVVLCILGRLVIFGLFGIAAERETLTTLGEIINFHLYQIAFGIAVGIAVGIAGGIAGGIAFGIAGGIAATRFYYHPFFWWITWPKPLGRFYHLHPLAWDDLCSVPFPNFDRLLVAFTEINPQEGAREIERLITSYPAQRHHALRAKTILLARQSTQTLSLSSLNVPAAQLPEGKKKFLAQTPRLRELIAEIARLQIRLDTISRPIFREPLVQALCEKIENFRHQISGFHEPLASEFRQAALHWLELAREQLQQAQAIAGKEPTRKSSAQAIRSIANKKRLCRVMAWWEIWKNKSCWQPAVRGWCFMAGGAWANPLFWAISMAFYRTRLCPCLFPCKTRKLLLHWQIGWAISCKSSLPCCHSLLLR